MRSPIPSPITIETTSWMAQDECYVIEVYPAPYDVRLCISGIGQAASENKVMVLNKMDARRMAWALNSYCDWIESGVFQR